MSPGMAAAAGAVVLICARTFAVTNLPLVSLSCLPCLPLLCLNNHYLFKHCVWAPDCGLQARNKCLSVEQPTVFMLSQTTSGLSF